MTWTCPPIRLPFAQPGAGAYVASMQHVSGPEDAPSAEQDGEKRRPRVRLHPDDEAGLLEALEDVRAGRTVALTPEELDEWERTGELPPAVETRFAALGCTESPS